MFCLLFHKMSRLKRLKKETHSRADEVEVNQAQSESTHTATALISRYQSKHLCGWTMCGRTRWLEPVTRTPTSDHQTTVGWNTQRWSIIIFLCRSQTSRSFSLILTPAMKHKIHFTHSVQNNWILNTRGIESRPSKAVFVDPSDVTRMPPFTQQLSLKMWTRNEILKLLNVSIWLQLKKSLHWWDGLVLPSCSLEHPEQILYWPGWFLTYHLHKNGASSCNYINDYIWKQKQTVF